MSRNIGNDMFNVNENMRWLIIILMFGVIAILDFFTRPEYVLAYLYTVPILVSLSFFRPRIAKSLLAVAVCATLLNLVFPHNVLNRPSVFVNRVLAVFSIGLSAYFMVQYIRHQTQAQAHEKRLATERNLARMREDFMATLSHDLKTPLLGEQKTLQYFLEGKLGGIYPEQAEVLEALLRAKQRQLELVDNLLSVYQQDNLGVALQMEPVDMDELIADVVTEMQSLATERSLSLEYRCRRTPPKVRGDAFQLKRVMANLLHNALNYTPAGGLVQVSVSEQAQGLCVEVADSGPGLAEADLDNVFHRFYRSEGTRDIVGTGLGLYLSRQLVQAHRGRIWAENLPGGGCKFCFILPVEGDSA